MLKTFRLALIGNPNSGKTTLFNNLTGSRQKIGNWPGVTVEKKSGFFKVEKSEIEVVDLPGIYSLVNAADTSIDEKITSEFILNSVVNCKDNPTIFINIIDASNLERNLYLTMQLREMHIPMIVVLNMMDVANSQNKKIHVEKLAEKLGCPVIPIQAHKAKGLKELKRAIDDMHCHSERSEESRDPSTMKLSQDDKTTPSQDDKRRPSQGDRLCHSERSEESRDPSTMELSQDDKTRPSQDDRFIHPTFLAKISSFIPEKYKIHTAWLATRLLEGDAFAENLVSGDVKAIVKTHQQRLHAEFSEDADILIADARYSYIQTILKNCLTLPNTKIKNWSAKIDNIVLNRFLGIPIFLGVMYCMFLFAINIGGAFQDFFDIGSDTIFVQGLGHLLSNLGTPNWLTALLANGVGKGINTTVTFIPVIGAMFLFLALLEDSGYMTRAAFVVDRVMQTLGLPGKAFVPMIVGFGCNVPAVMATRTLENKRDRILTVMMSPFMSCGARLAIYAVFTAAFFPVGGQNVVFVLYLIGIAAAMLTGLLLRKTILKGESSPLIMEMPAYHIPHMKTVLLHAWQRLRNFLFRAGKLIVPICILVGMLSALHPDGSLSASDGDAHSMLSAVGKFFTPLFAPMGIHQDNWPATVGLVTGILAKEVVIGTLNALYTQVGHLASLQAAGFNFWHGMHDAMISIPQNLSQLGSSLGNPVLAQAPVHTLSQRVYGVMYQRFDGQIGAIAYLLFVLLYFPCVSTTAAIARELNRGWAIFSVVWTTVVAYGVAVCFYQAMTFAKHPLSSVIWLVSLSLIFCFTILSIKNYSTHKPQFKTLAGDAV